MSNYIIAMIKEATRKKGSVVTMLYTGRGYTKEQAELRAAQMNVTCGGELKALGYSVFVAYNPCSE